jgi:hypothetical protein
MDDEKTITLRKPVKLGEIEYTKLDLREPTAGELEKASNATSNIGVVITLIHLVAQVPRRVVEGLSQRDLKEAGDFLDVFSKAAPTTGETSSPT